ncbi:hypothetical protein LTR08_007883 [Meristemomyces frigidus]|nr:hypothetical protein LTR08_007883 [Meristemomyces frigidus]
MDDIIQLRCRNAGLETELRLVKEQLTQAHGATNYLVTTLSNQHSAQEHSATARLRERLERAQEENAHLRALLDMGSNAKKAITAGRHNTQALQDRIHSQVPPSPPSTESEQDDLLSFDDGDDAASTPALALPSHRRTAVGHPPISNPDASSKDHLGLGITDHVSKPQSTTTPPHVHDPPIVADGENIHKIGHADGSHSFVMATPATSFFRTPTTTNSPYYQRTPSTAVPPRGPRWRVQHGLYCFLLDRACFAEDWEDGDWAGFSRQKGVMDVEGWKRYYAEVVRPRYLEIEAGKAAAVRGVVGAVDEGLAAQEERMAAQEEERMGEEDRSAEVDDDDDGVPTIGDDDATEVDEEEGGAESGGEGIDDGLPESKDDSTDAEDDSPLEDMEIREVEERTAEKPEEGADLINMELEADDGAVDAGVEEAMSLAVAQHAEPAVESADSAEPAVPEQGLETSRWAPTHAYQYVQPPVAPATNTKPDTPALSSINEYLDSTTDLQAQTSSPNGHPDNARSQPPPETTTPPAPRAPHLTAHGQPGPNNDTFRYDPRARPFFARTDPFHSQPPHLPQGPIRALPNAHPDLTPEIKALLFSQAPPQDLRTVLITGLPPTTTLAEVLEKVRGGKVVGAELLRTEGWKSQVGREEMNGALVTFLYSQDARTYVEFVGRVQDIFFWHEYWDAPMRARVEMVGTSSRVVAGWLKGVGVSRAVYLADNYDNNNHNNDYDEHNDDNDNGDAQALTAQAVVASVTSWAWEERNAWRGLQHCPPIRAERDGDGILAFEFASMGMAGHFRVALERVGVFGGMAAGFLPDGCAREVRTLGGVGFAGRPAHCVDGDLEGSEGEGGVNGEERRSATTDSTDMAAVAEEGAAASDSANPSREAEYGLATATEAVGGRYPNDDLELARALMRSFTRAGGRNIAPHLRARAGTEAEEGGGGSEEVAADAWRRGWEC